ncbi:MAG: hypothetical protein ACHQJ6_05545 [Candidatus Berkiellales bacterium]
MNINRYRFYREHKFVSFKLFELEKLIAKSNFKLNKDIEIIKQSLLQLADLMNNHAAFEDKAIHTLLRQKGSTVHEKIEEEHQHHHQQYNALKDHLEAILLCDENEREAQGHQFYLNYRLFVAENLIHLHQEETLIMPELQRLYSDEELRLVEFNTFHHMTPEHMAEMIATLAQHINPSDLVFFLNEMKTAEPDKFLASGLS